MQLQRTIEQLGYSPNAAKVYLAALSLGEAHVTDIAEKTKLPRTSVQAIVEMLHADGLMNFYVARRYKYWVAENPERLLANLKRREETVREALPELAALRLSSRGTRAKKSANGYSLFRALANAISQPVLIANENAEIVYVNSQWEKHFGYSCAEVRGKNPRMLQSGKTPQAVYDTMWKMLNAGTMFQSDEIIDKRKDGSTFTLRTTMFPVRHGGRVSYVQIFQEK